MDLKTVNAEEESERLAKLYNIELNSIHYHYEACGNATMGLHEYKVIKVGEGCMCYTPYYVDFATKDNYGREYTKHASSKEFKREFFPTKKEAYLRYMEYLKDEICEMSETIDNLHLKYREIKNIVDCI